MFRNRNDDDDTQKELDMNTNSNNKNSDNSGGAYGADNKRAAAPRAAAPATGYRPGAQAPAARPAPVTRPGGAPAGNADTRQPSGNAAKSKRILTVGNDILLKGEIATCDRLVIEGMVDASLKDVHTVEISETGSFKGTAEIQDAEISGLFEGELMVRNRLTIYSTGQVRGKISYGEIEIERGGELTGEIGLGGVKKSDNNADKNKKAS